MLNDLTQMKKKSLRPLHTAVPQPQLLDSQEKLGEEYLQRAVCLWSVACQREAWIQEDMYTNHLINHGKQRSCILLH